jgi:hypothetical protein
MRAFAAERTESGQDGGLRIDTSLQQDVETFSSETLSFSAGLR